MVYLGKPSAGCVNCRKRKIKCDEKTPACTQCLNTKRTCPGYVSRIDLVLRDQTKSVRRKAQRKKAGQPANATTTSAQDSTPNQNRSFNSQRSSFLTEEFPSHSFTADSDAFATHALTKRASSSSTDGAVPRISNDFPEQQAICAFFLDFVLLSRHPDSVRGHLEYLLPLYTKAGAESPLRLATSSVALTIAGGQKDGAKALGREFFGKALKRTSIAIRDPVDSFKDETLMAVLLLGLFERISATTVAAKTRSAMTSTHNAGAGALVKHRGAANCRSPLSIGLLFAVRTQLVEHAIEEGQGFKRCPDDLSAMFRALPQNAAARLTSATINIADLKSCAKSALLLPRGVASEKEVNDLLEYAISIDLLVAAWPESVPPDWKWTPSDAFDLPGAQKQSLPPLITTTYPTYSNTNTSPSSASTTASNNNFTFPPSLPSSYSFSNPSTSSFASSNATTTNTTNFTNTTPTSSRNSSITTSSTTSTSNHKKTSIPSSFIYNTRPPDTYTDLWVMSIWNQYRSARLKIQRIILDCIAWLGPEYDEQWYWRGVYARMIAQEMADDVCASVPLGLGTRVLGGLAGAGGVGGGMSAAAKGDAVEFPYVRAKGKVSEEHARAAAVVGGWHLLDPLKSAIQVNAPGRAERGIENVLRDGQVDWMCMQMERIGRIYGLHAQKGNGSAGAGVGEGEGLVGGVGDGVGLGGGFGVEGGGGRRRRGEGKTGESEGGVWQRHSFEFPV